MRRASYTGTGRDEDKMSVEQLVLPRQCQDTVLQLAHKVPLAGHMGKTKTARRILQQFYQPSLFKDVVEYCKRCPECQMCSTRKESRAPFIPLPLVEEPFKRIPMDIDDPLPHSQSGSWKSVCTRDLLLGYSIPGSCPLTSH